MLRRSTSGSAGSPRRVGIALLGLVIAQTYLATNFMIGVLPYHGQPAARDRDAHSVRDTVRVGFRRLLDRDGGIRAAARSAGDRYRDFAQLRRATRRIDPAGAHRDRHADLQRERRPRVRGAARDATNRWRALASSRTSISSCSPTPAIPTCASPSSKRWLGICRAVGGFGRMFYRWRQHRIKRKSGNIADFCRRWGGNYRYMVVLDADSVMSGTMPDDAAAADGSQSRRRHHPDRAARRRPRDACTRASSSSQRASTARCSPRACISGSSANRTTGATTRSSASRRSCAIARSDGFPDAARSPARSSRTISSKPR